MINNSDLVFRAAPGIRINLLLLQSGYAAIWRTRKEVCTVWNSAR